jgi:hypothetical protein
VVFTLRNGKKKSQPRIKIRAYGNNISTRQPALSDMYTIDCKNNRRNWLNIDL